MNKKIRKGDVIKTEFEWRNSVKIYFRVGFIRKSRINAFLIWQTKKPGLYVLKMKDITKVLDRKEADLFESNIELLNYLKLYD